MPINTSHKHISQTHFINTSPQTHPHKHIPTNTSSTTDLTNTSPKTHPPPLLPYRSVHSILDINAVHAEKVGCDVVPIAEDHTTHPGCFAILKLPLLALGHSILSFALVAPQDAAAYGRECNLIQDHFESQMLQRAKCGAVV